jgi:YHS domain-containing protein
MVMKNLASTFILMLILNAAFGQQEVFSKLNEAIQGYDPVAYFKDSKAIKGKKELSYTWKGASWLFSSEQNLNDFKSNPEKFAPQFGGYCAYGVADGHKAPTSPDAWTIVDGKLYLNYDKGVRELWDKDRDAFVKKANANWPTVKKEKD